MLVPCLRQLGYHDDVCYNHSDAADKQPFSCKYTSRCASDTCNCKTCDDPTCKPQIANANSCTTGSKCGTEGQYCPPNRPGAAAPDGSCCRGGVWAAGTCDSSGLGVVDSSAVRAERGAERGKFFVQGRNARSLLSTAGWELVDHPEDADLVCVINRCHLGAYIPAPRSQAFNLLPWDQPMTDKALLAKHLHAFDAVVGEGDPLGKSSRIIPPTFHLNDLKQKRGFVAAIKACEAGSRPGAASSGGTVSACGQPWILKRTDLSNGQGATIVPRPSAAWAAGPELANLTAHGHRWIAQRYITDLLLLDGRKSELRVYWLVASLKPLVVLYNTGTVRLNAAKYTRSDYGNDLVHITNTRRQLLNTSLGDAAENHGRALELKWSHRSVIPPHHHLHHHHHTHTHAHARTHTRARTPRGAWWVTPKQRGELGVRGLGNRRRRGAGVCARANARRSARLPTDTSGLMCRRGTAAAGGCATTWTSATAAGRGRGSKAGSKP